MIATISEKLVFFHHLTDCSWYNIHLRILQCFGERKWMREVGGGKGGPGRWNYKNMLQNIGEYTYSSLWIFLWQNSLNTGWGEQMKSCNFFIECWLKLLTAKAPQSQLPIWFLYWRASPSGTLKATSGETSIQRNAIQLC